MKNTKLEQKEVIADVVEVENFVTEPNPTPTVTQVKKKVGIQYRNTPNKQVFVSGDANAEFEVIDDANGEVVGKGKTTDKGESIVICSYISKTLKAIALSLICVINIFAQQTTQVNVQQQTVTATAPLVKTGNVLSITPASTTSAGSMSIADKKKLDSLKVISLTTLGTGASTLINGVLNIPTPAPAVSLTNNAAPFTFNATTQAGNIPQVPSIVAGQLVQGDGTPAEQIPDFWRTVTGTLLPDGTIDVTDEIKHNSDIYVGLDGLMTVGHGGGNQPVNTAVGNLSLNANTTGTSNTANGFAALYSNTTGISNTANGNAALYSNTTGNYNTANGNAALRSNTTGNYNTANGNAALYYNQESNNTAVGDISFNSYNTLATSGVTATASTATQIVLSAPMTPSPPVNSYIAFINIAGYTNTISGLTAPKSYKVINATTLEVTDPSQVLGLTGTATNFEIRQSKGYTNSSALGYNSEPTASNQVMLGDVNVTQVVSSGTFFGAGFTVASDKRIKSEIKDLTPEMITALKSIKPKIYKNANTGKTEMGVIAQDIPAILRPYLVTIIPQVYSKEKSAELKLTLAKKLGYKSVSDYTKAVAANDVALLLKPNDEKLLEEKERLTITNDTAYLTDFYSVDYAKLAAMVALVK